MIKNNNNKKALNATARSIRQSKQEIQVKEVLSPGNKKTKARFGSGMAQRYASQPHFKGEEAASPTQSPESKGPKKKTGNRASVTAATGLSGGGLSSHFGNSGVNNSRDFGYKTFYQTNDYHIVRSSKTFGSTMPKPGHSQKFSQNYVSLSHAQMADILVDTDNNAQDAYGAYSIERNDNIVSSQFQLGRQVLGSHIQVPNFRRYADRIPIACPKNKVYPDPHPDRFTNINKTPNCHSSKKHQASVFLDKYSGRDLKKTLLPVRPYQTDYDKCVA